MNRVTRHCTLIFCLLLCVSATSVLQAGTIFPVDSIRTQTFDCSGNLGVCIGIPAAELSKYTILQNGMPYGGNVSGCDFDTIITYSYNTLLGAGNLGPYRLDSWTVNGQVFSGTFANIPALVTMLNQFDPVGNWVNQPNSLTIKGGAPGNTYSNMQVTVLINNTPSTLGMNFGLNPQGTLLEFTAGDHTLIAIENATGLKDTLIVTVECIALPVTTIIYDTIQANEYPYSICMNNSELLGIPTSITNICPAESGEFVLFHVDTTTFCVKYQGIKCGGQEKACIVVCDDAGMCDTTEIIVTVDFSLCHKISQKWTDTILVNFTKTICLDTSGLLGPVVNVENVCPNESGTSVVFEYDETTHCVTYTGIKAGTERACYLMQDALGNMDTAYVCVTTRLPQSGIIIDTLLLGQNETYCIDTTELAGNIVSIQNFCPASSGQAVNFVPNNVSLCVEAQSLAIGTDTACIVICDSYGICDTTTVIITVNPDVGNPCANSLPPVANNDMATTLLNTPVTIDILANDQLGTCVPYSLNILSPASINGPKHGFTLLQPNQMVEFVPESGYCGLDTFRYELCNVLGCDTAIVLVKIACVPWDTIIIYNGFSPNGDGFNDVFTIENIEHHPDNDLKVFNRWGNLVYNLTGYKNSWDGTYRSADLPDGTYYYVLKLDPKDDKTYSGFLIINR